MAENGVPDYTDMSLGKSLFLFTSAFYTHVRLFLLTNFELFFR